MFHKNQPPDEKAELLRQEEAALNDEELAQAEGGTLTNSVQGNFTGGVFQPANTIEGLGQRAFTATGLGIRPSR